MKGIKFWLLSLSVLSLSTVLNSCEVEIGDNDDNSNNSNKTENKDGHEYVDLGLSVKWSTCNIGATTMTGEGNHYSWGEVTPIDGSYDYEGWSESKYIAQGVMTSDGVLTKEHDAATVNWGDNWRMPTAEEAQELYKKCTWKQETLNGVKGYRVTAKNGNSLFFPAVGVIKSATDKAILGDGYYWTSSFSPEPSSAKSFVMFSDGTLTIHWKHTRHDGVVIRPVLNK